MRAPISILLASFVLFSCSKKKDDPPTPAAPPTGGGGTSSLTMSSHPGVQMTMNGTNISWTSSTGWAPYLTSSGGGNWSYGAGVSRFDPDKAFYAKLGSLEGSFQPSQAEFNAFFTTGERAYTPDHYSMDGVSFTYFEDYDQWSTQCGSADQSGSAFNITNVEVVNDLFNPYVKVLATFTCTLYPCEGGASGNKVVSGTIRANYERI